MFGDKCKISIYLAYAMLIYTFASTYYLIRTINVGTPFKDSLTKKQKIIKKKSANKRRNIFRNGLLLGILYIYIARPFKLCNN